jgi:iron complex outermembrane recepter protein
MGTALKLRVHRVASLAAAISAAIGSTSAANAQQLEEIIVTAERRELNLQDTPISVMSFEGEALELRGVEDMFDLATIAPNLDIKGARGVGNTSPTFQIRGISGGGGATGERSVGFYVDNVFMPRATGPVMRVLDVERIEVLRGPQGTLFGRNSTGGAIRVFSRKPEMERDGYLRLSLGNFDHQDIQGMINVPLGDELAVRAQLASLQEDGFVRRGPQMLGGNDDTIARVQFAWNPSDTLGLTFGAMHTDSKSDGSPTDMTLFNMDPICPLAGGGPFYCLQGNYADWVSDFLQTSGQERLRQNDARLVADDYAMPDWCFLDDANPDWDDLCRQWNDAKYTQVDANIDWQITENLTLISTTGVSEFSSSGVSDWQLLGMEFRPAGVESEVLYQEFQFNFSLADGKVEFITGVNYFNEDSGSPRESLINAIGSSNYANNATGGAANGNLWGCNDTLGVPCTGSTVRRLRITGDSVTEQEATAYGLFANTTIHFGERLNLTLGVRESHDEKVFSNELFASDNFIPQFGGSTIISAEDDWSATDYRGTVDFNVTDDFMLYVTSSRAFRSGTFSIPPTVAVCAVAVVPPAPCPAVAYHRRPQPAAVPPETLLNDELGFRSEWFDGRLRFNATYYEMEYTDRQGASAVADPTAPTGFRIDLVNQGDVDLWGSEIEAMFAVTDRFTIEGATGRANYEMSNPCINNGPYLFPPPMDREHTLSGRYELPSPTGNFSFSLSLTKTGPMQTHPGGFTPAELASITCFATPQAAVFPSTFIDSRYEVPSYNLANLSVRYTANSGKWTGTLFANNLTDEVYANNAQSFGRGFWTAGGPPGAIGLSAAPRQAIADYRGRPREMGITFQYNFF